jgi:hypothetical protein
MIKSVASLAVLASAVVISCVANAAPQWNGQARPMFVVPTDHSPLPVHNAPGHVPPPVTLQTWSGGFTDLMGHAVTFKMVGQDPATSNTDTHVKIVLIPVVMVYGATNGNMTFDPSADHTGGKGKRSVMKQLSLSPMFDGSSDFNSGAIDCGTTQYIDAFQRCTFWGNVSTNTGYHTILDVTNIRGVKPLTINVSASNGSVINNPFGTGVVGTMKISSFDAQLTSYLTSHNTKITPDIFPFFISYDVYLTSGGCCIGGYHSARGAQTYGYTTYVDSPGAFSEDIDAVSHEVGEWMDDPFTNNGVHCNDNSILEVGDPLEGLPNYGTFTVTQNRFTWHPQSLAMMPYFGAPTSTSANGWVALHNDITNVCPGQ